VFWRPCRCPKRLLNPIRSEALSAYFVWLENLANCCCPTSWMQSKFQDGYLMILVTLTEGRTHDFVGKKPMQGSGFVLMLYYS
jgi:hypothetical protein